MRLRYIMMQNTKREMSVWPVLLSYSTLILEEFRDERLLQEVDALGLNWLQHLRPVRYDVIIAIPGKRARLSRTTN